VIADSFRPEATFLNCLVVARFLPDRSVTVRDLKVIFSDARSSRVELLYDREALVQAVERHCGIPSRIVAEAIGGLTLGEPP
jgi:hypothetical protein